MSDLNNWGLLLDTIIQQASADREMLFDKRQRKQRKAMLAKLAAAQDCIAALALATIPNAPPVHVSTWGRYVNVSLAETVSPQVLDALQEQLEDILVDFDVVVEQVS